MAQQMGEGNSATKESKGRTSDGGPDHHLRDGATARAKEEGRQEEEGDNETQQQRRMDPGMAGADYATRRNRRTRIAIKDGITGIDKEHSAKAARAKSTQHGSAVDSLQLPPRPALAD